MKEIFRDIKGFEGYYQVSNHGRVKSLSRYVKHSKGGNRLVKGRVLKSSVNSAGYCLIVLCVNRKKKPMNIHQLVAMAFLGHVPCGNSLVVNHKDFDRTNNHVSNLEVVTHRVNGNKKHINSSSKYTGVSWNKEKRKWAATIHVDGKSKGLGRFNSEFRAHLAYQYELLTIV